MINLKWFHLLLICWGIILFNGDVPGTIEGKFLPTVTEFKITKSNPDSYSTIFYGTFKKERQCVFLDIDWYLTHKEYGDSKMRVTFEDGETIRVPGKHTYGPWKVNLLIDKIEGNSYAFVRHKCHPLWTTITKVYP